MRGGLAHPRQLACGLTFLAFAGAVAAAPLSPPPSAPHPPWIAALRSADRSLLAAAMGGSGLGLTLVAGSMLTLPRRRHGGRRSVHAHRPEAPFDATAAVQRAVAMIKPQTPADGVVEELTRRMTSLFASTEIEKRVAATLLDAGDVVAAARRLEAIARRQDEVFGPRSRMAAQTWREFACLRLVGDELQALEGYRRGGRRDPDDYWGQLFLAGFAHGLGVDSRTARRAAEDAVRTAASTPDRVTALKLMGDIAQAAGDFIAARGAHGCALDMCRQHAAREPTDAARLRDVSLFQERLGDVEAAAGNPRKALWRYRESLAIAARQVVRDPTDSDWRLAYLGARSRVAALQSQVAEAT